MQPVDFYRCYELIFGANTNPSKPTNSFGHYRFDGVTAGRSYVFGVAAKRYTFIERLVRVADAVANLDFIAEE